MPTTSKTYRKNPHSAGRLLNGRAFVITPDQNKLVTLNSTASHLWQLGEKAFTATDAIESIFEKFQVSRDALAKDIPVALDDLVKKQVLVEDAEGQAA